MIYLSDFQPLSIAKIEYFSSATRGFREDIQWKHTKRKEKVKLDKEAHQDAKLNSF